MMTVAPGTLEPELSVTAPKMLPYSTWASPVAGMQADGRDEGEDGASTSLCWFLTFPPQTGSRP